MTATARSVVLGRCTEFLIKQLSLIETVNRSVMMIITMSKCWQLYSAMLSNKVRVWYLMGGANARKGNCTVIYIFHA